MQNELRYRDGRSVRADFQCMLQYGMFPQTLNYKNL